MLEVHAHATGVSRKMSERPRRADPLFMHVGALADFSSALIVLAEYAPDRLTMAQGVFFLLAAAADLSGKPATFSSLQETVGPVIGKSLHSTYKALIDENRKRDGKQTAGVGWLLREEDPSDRRQKFLRLTPKGREVIREVAAALTGEDL